MSLAPGSRLGPYEILSLIGAGGMGEVYRARDASLKRDVAIKVLPTSLARDGDRLRRFELEAEAAAALNHPNILSIFHVGEHDGSRYLVTELLHGETLRERLYRGALRLREALDLAIGVAHGLAAAHGAGIVHRDLKPENLFVTKDGHVKILDFGLAKLTDPLAIDGTTASLNPQTNPGQVLGTVGYMSPEQVRGQPADARSDIFGFGAILYEMLTGKRAFRRPTAAETMCAILNEDLPTDSQFSSGVPPPLQKVVRRCVEKTPDQRFQSALDAAFALDALLDSGGSLSRLHSLAVLPFINGTGLAEADYLSEGISESIINLLSQFPDLRVVPRTSAFRYRGREKKLKKVGRDLNVDSVLTGTVVQRGDTLIVQAELVDIANDAQLWGDQYDRKLEDIFELQAELARRISESLRPRLTPDEAKFLTVRPTENHEAYHLYLRAMYFTNKWTPEGIYKGIEYSKQAIEIDPLFARAYAGLSYLYILVSSLGSLPPLQAFPIAKAAALKALEIDDSLADAHASLAYILLAYDWDWLNAGKESSRAIELAPNLPGGHYVRSQWCIVNGLAEEAIVEARRALNLDPLSLPNYVNLALIYHLLRQFDPAIEELQKALELDPSFIAARQLLALSYAFTGKYQEAFNEADASAALPGANIRADIRARATLGLINAVAGRNAEARKALAELTQYSKPPDYLPAADCAYIHALLGEKEQTFEWLEKAYLGHASTLFYIKLRPMFETLHTDPRFSNLLSRIGLPQ
jgi:serine/threonine protein kinase/tetratricopeptide (TPR) repeat protein